MTETRRARMAEKAARNKDRIVIEDMPDVDLEIMDEEGDPTTHRLVDIEHTKHGKYLIKCQQCNRETRRINNSALVCNSCPRKPVLCDQRWKSECFDKWHKNDGYEMVPNVRGGQGLIPQALVGRELGHICHNVNGCKWIICIKKKTDLGEKHMIKNFGTFKEFRKLPRTQLPCFNVLSKSLQKVSVALDHRKKPSSDEV